MLAILYYCLKVIICSGLLYGYYLLALRNNRFHQWNRFYLLAIVLISFTLPFIKIPLPFFPDDAPVIQSLTILSAPDVYFSKVYQRSFDFTWPMMLGILYICIALFLITLFIRNVLKVQRLKRMYPYENLNGIHFYNTIESGTPFSFFKNIFWNSGISLNNEKGQQMLRHEITHIQEKHSVDKVGMEILIALAWWNPFLYYIRKELSVIHEFIADKKASAGDDNLQYASLLLMKAMGSEQYALGNPFFHTQLKRRLTMLTTNKNPKLSYLRRLMVLPLAALAIVLFSFKYKEGQKEKIKNKTEESSIQLPKVTAAEPLKVHAFYQDTTKNRIIIKTEKKYKGKFIESITPTTDKKGIIVKTTDNNTYFLNREEAKKELDIIVTDKSFTAPPGSRVVMTDDNNVPADNYSLDSDSLHLNITSLSIHKSGAPEGFADALITIDGVEVAAAKMQELNADNIESVDVLKGETAIAKYGEKGKNGVIVITTKKALPDNVLYVIDGNVFTKLAMNQLDPSSIISVNVWKGDKAVEKFGEKGRNGVIEIFTKTATITDNALYIIDGVESTKEEFNKLHEEGNIISVNILKDEAATKDYGNKGKNGVILVATKRKAKEILTQPSKEDKLREIAVTGYQSKKEAEVAARLEKRDKLQEVIVTGYGTKKDASTVTQSAQKEKLKEVTVAGYKTEPEIVFTKAEIMASFPGGLDGWRKYLQTNLKYPETAQKKGTQGTIRVQITVEKDGSLSEIKVLNNLGDGLAEEAVRVLKQGPKWNPAEQNGRKVSSRFIQTISFKLSTPVS